jgi:hypothetical protein
MAKNGVVSGIFRSEFLKRSRGSVADLRQITLFTTFIIKLHENVIHIAVGENNAFFIN